MVSSSARVSLSPATSAPPAPPIEEVLSGTDSWYLDPLVAVQKREANVAFFEKWADGFPAKVVVKTDLFEEANNLDRILFDLDRGQEQTLGFDIAMPTVRKAARAGRGSKARMMAADARQLPFAENSVDLILSTSTLDHFDYAEDFEASIVELGRILRPGGRLVLTMDNPWNPTYQLLRAVCRLPSAPFELGYTPSKSRLTRNLTDAGLEPLGWQPILHNPRLISTVMWMAMRRGLGRHADGAIRRSLWAFEQLDKLPTRWLTCCFNGVCAEKRA